ncbi:c-type cytochrome [Pseudorhodoplanes sp.]|uniref:c-type cytochrome n=1 Tax=Pseudorhodoplanes sp. TaxID=1934341 RepID=UPI003918C933
MRMRSLAFRNKAAPLAAISALCLLVLPLAAQAQQAAGGGRTDLKNGADLAKRWCASCHLVSKDQAKAIEGVPTFAELARRSDLAGERLIVFLLGPHPPMPPIGLSRDEARDLAAYIAAQR